MTLPELYQKKGELTTTIEVAQAQLQAVNQRIAEKLNEKPVTKEKKGVA